jgi:hypothetical protein
MSHIEFWKLYISENIAVDIFKANKKPGHEYIMILLFNTFPVTPLRGIGLRQSSANALCSELVL